MLWDHTIPRQTARDSEGRTTEITVIAGTLGTTKPPGAPPDSWASRADADVAIWSIKMTPGAEWTLPATLATTNRTVYFFRGDRMTIGERSLVKHSGVRLRPDADVRLVAGKEPVEVLLLQGKPIGEPVVQYGPFVMNTAAEIQQAFRDFQRTRFGGWPWPKDDPTHGKTEGRFARHANGKIERVEEPVPVQSSITPLGSSAGSV
jgi:redox-sensitive bicupin YhaK (pirin superfamily)